MKNTHSRNFARNNVVVVGIRSAISSVSFHTKTQRTNKSNTMYLYVCNHEMDAVVVRIENGNCLKIANVNLFSRHNISNSNGNCHSCFFVHLSILKKMNGHNVIHFVGHDVYVASECFCCLPLFVDSRYQCHIAELLIVQIGVHITQSRCRMIFTVKIFILLADCAGRCQTGQAKVPRNRFIGEQCRT